MPKEFRTSFFGYNKKQVDEALIHKSREYDDAMALKNERFIEMRDQNNIMKVELADYRRKEQEISSVLIKARSIATEMIQEGEQSAYNEKSRLMEEIKQLDRLAQAMYQRLEDTMMQASDCVHGFEQDLNMLLEKKEAFLKATYGFDK